MENIQEGSGCAYEARIGSVGSDVHFDRKYGYKLQKFFPCDQNVLVAVPQ